MSWGMVRGLARILCRPRNQCCDIPVSRQLYHDVTVSEDSGRQSMILIPFGLSARVIGPNPNRKTLILQSVTETLGGVNLAGAVWSPVPVDFDSSSPWGNSNIPLILTYDVHGSIVCREWWAANPSVTTGLQVLAIESWEIHK